MANSEKLTSNNFKKVRKKVIDGWHEIGSGNSFWECVLECGHYGLSYKGIPKKMICEKCTNKAREKINDKE
uniref:Uncharacterized protein n=1 Tax=viral metagenome TaxID=1070528 RepID=A0A6M3IXW7_9ZZZZ